MAATSARQHPRSDEAAIPHLPEVERAVLGSLILDATLLQTCERLRFTSDGFFLPSNRTIFLTMLEHAAQHPREFDPMSLAEYMRADGSLNAVGGPAYLSSLYDGVPLWCSEPTFASRLRLLIDAHQKRVIQRHAAHIAASVEDGERTPHDLAKEMRSVVERIETDSVSAPIRFGALLDDCLARMERRRTQPPQGLRFGIGPLDDLLGGLQPNHLCVIAARPRVGKTTFGLQSILQWLYQVTHSVMFYSLEMSAEQITDRLVMIAAAIDSRSMRRGLIPASKVDDLAATVAGLRGLPLEVRDRVPATFRAIAADAHLEAKRRGVGAVVVDHLGLLKYDNHRWENRVQELSEITRGLKLLARDLQIPVITLVQLNREIENRGRDPRPRLSDLRESGSTEQDADQVIFLTRDLETEAERGEAHITVEKNRHGLMGRIDLSFNRQLGAFEW